MTGSRDSPAQVSPGGAVAAGRGDHDPTVSLALAGRRHLRRRPDARSGRRPPPPSKGSTAARSSLRLSPQKRFQSRDAGCIGWSRRTCGLRECRSLTRARRVVRQWLDANATAPHPWMLSPNTAFSLPESMAHDIGDYEFRRATATFNHRPDRESSETNVEYRFTYRRRPAAPCDRVDRYPHQTEGAAAGEAAAKTWFLDEPAPGVKAWGHAAASEILIPADMVSVTEALRAAAAGAWGAAARAASRSDRRRPNRHS